jgi:hypothetical protein
MRSFENYLHFSLTTIRVLKSWNYYDVGDESPGSIKMKAKLSLRFIKHHALNTYGEVEEELHHFQLRNLVSGQLHAPTADINVKVEVPQTYLVIISTAGSKKWAERRIFWFPGN